MYHIAHDKRAENSAQKLYQALLDCLDTKPFSDITVADIFRASGVSRATFYRLFDNTVDVLIWRCDQIFEEATARFNPARPASFEEVALAFISSLMDEPQLVPVLTSSTGAYVLHDVHARHMGTVKTVFLRDMELSPIEQDQLAELLAAIIPVTLRIWQQYPEERPTEIFRRVRSSVNLLARVFEPKR